MAQNAPLADQLESLAKSLTETAQSVRDSPDGVSPSHRLQLSNASHSILRSVQQPGEQLMEAMVTVVQITVMRLFIKWKVFETIPLQGNISYVELAAKAGADTSLISESPGRHRRKGC